MPRHIDCSVTRISSVTSAGTAPTGDRDRRVAVPAVDDRAAVDRDHVALDERPVAGDAVDDLVVHRRADGGREAVVAQERRRRAGGADAVLGDRVELARS